MEITLTNFVLMYLIMGTLFAATAYNLRKKRDQNQKYGQEFFDELKWKYGINKEPSRFLVWITQKPKHEIPGILRGFIQTILWPPFVFLIMLSSVMFLVWLLAGFKRK